MFIPPHNLRRMLAVGVAAIVTASLVATPAMAHTELRASDPEEGAEVDTLDQVRLEFSSALLDIGSELVLVDAEGAQHELVPEFPAGEHAVVAPVDSQEIAPGDAVLDWRIVAEDGHPIDGEIHFTYTPAVADEPAPEPAPEQAPADDPATDGQEAGEQTAPAVEPTPISAEPISDEPEAGSNTVWAWVLIGLAVIGLAVTAIGLNRKRDNA